MNASNEACRKRNTAHTSVCVARLQARPRLATLKMRLASERQALCLYETAQNDCSASRAALESYEDIDKFRRTKGSFSSRSGIIGANKTKKKKKTSPNLAYAYTGPGARGSRSAQSSCHLSNSNSVFHRTASRPTKDVLPKLFLTG